MKKRTITVLILSAISYLSIAQQNEETNNEVNFNQWSLEISAGINKPSRPLSTGSFSNTPSLYGASIGTRYMFNEFAGVKAGLGLQNFSNDRNSADFDSNLYTFSLEGIINGGNILNFNDWTNTFSFLMHGGLGYSRFTSSTPIDRNFGSADQILNYIIGITPQIKLSEKVSLIGDISAIGNVRQDLNFDGTVADQTIRGFNGFFMTASVGIQIYLGKKEVHADWFIRKTIEDKKIEALEERIAKLETDLIDTDQDGVADYLDREKNTVSGVAVDTKGYALDTNKNGIPDELESALEAQYAKKSDLKGLSSGSSSDVIGKLLNDGYVNVYFQFNSTKPELYSLEAINYLIKYLSENPNKKAELIGYADEVGDTVYNQQLSEKRAKRVLDILIASGVNANRLSITGAGEDTGISSSDARQLVRRVTFKLK